MSVILVGYRGCGKTTVGRQLAGRLRCELVDTDAIVVQMAGLSIQEIFAQRGEAGFRAAESAALEAALRQEGAVISTGGGIVTVAANRQRLVEAAVQTGRPVVYLSAPAEVLWERIRADAATAANRPALTGLGGGLEEVRHLLALREPLYREVAGMVVDASAPAEEIVEEIMRHIGNGSAR